VELLGDAAVRTVRSISCGLREMEEPKPLATKATPAAAWPTFGSKTCGSAAPECCIHGSSWAGGVVAAFGETVADAADCFPADGATHVPLDSVAGGVPGIAVLDLEVAVSGFPPPPSALAACHKASLDDPLLAATGVGPAAEGFPAAPPPLALPPPEPLELAEPPKAPAGGFLRLPPSGSANGSANGSLDAADAVVLLGVGVEVVGVIAALPARDAAEMVAVPGAVDDVLVVLVLAGLATLPVLTALVPLDTVPAVAPTIKEPGGFRSSKNSTAKCPRNTVTGRRRFQLRSHCERKKEERFHAIVGYPGMVRQSSC
jgi:hypothetical protein